LKSSNTSPDSHPPLARGCLLLILLATVCGSAAYAIDPDRAMSQYIRDHWGTEQGFPRGPVYAITRASDGYLWIGTDAGLFRFDGWNFSLVKDSSRAFATACVLGIIPDNDGGLWLRMRDLSALRYRHGTFENPLARPVTDSYISAMSRGNHGGLLVARMEHGAFEYQSGTFKMLAPANNLPRSPVMALAQTPEGTIWIGTRDAGLYRLSANRSSSIAQGLPDPKINCLLPDGDRELWVGTDNGLVRWNGTELTLAGIPATLNRFQALALVKDRDGNLWVGTDSRGLLRVNRHGVSSFEGSEHSGVAVTALFEDREGNLWLGSASGIERIRDGAFVTYSHSEGLPADGSTPVFVDAESRMWFAPAGGGLWWSKDGLHGHVTEAGLDKDVVYSIAGGNGDLWLGRQRGGLTRLRFEGGSFTAKTWAQADGLAQNSVYAVYQTRNGDVWAGTLSGGVSRFQNGKFTSYTSATGLASNTVSSILETADGTMWFATPSGLSAFSKGHWHTWTKADGLPSENLNSLLEDSAGTLWIGTASGLAFRGPGGFQVPAGGPPSLREQILGMAEDRFGSLWLATSNHVLRVKRNKLVQGDLADGDIREYGLADGLRGLEGVKRHRSVVADASGRIWFSMNQGISVVDPGRLRASSTPAIVQIQTISADGRSIQMHGPVHVPAAPKRIVFGLAGLSLSVPERVRFRYTLEGYDHGWSEPTAAREAAYTNLGPGPYRLRVVASNPDGVWNNAEAAIAFDIAPLFWQAWWFRVTAVVAFALAFLALYRLRLHQFTRQLNIRFEERLAERTRIAQELHDTLLQGFLSASMQLHIAADQVSADSPAKRQLNHILQLMGQVIEDGRSALKGLRSSQATSLGLEQAFSQIRQELSVQTEVSFRVIVEGRPRSLRPLLRDEVYRIGREALVNAFRHSQAKRIEMELEYSTRHLRVLVRDNGCGIDPLVVRSGREAHWGLPGMRERAERIGARFDVWSSATAGTEVELSVPGHIAFQLQPESGRWRWLGRLYARRDRTRARDAGTGIENG
jgi:ligand-binding sensor domain-containing protein